MVLYLCLFIFWDVLYGFADPFDGSVQLEFDLLVEVKLFNPLVFVAPGVADAGALVASARCTGLPSKVSALVRKSVGGALAGEGCRVGISGGQSRFLLVGSWLSTAAGGRFTLCAGR